MAEEGVLSTRGLIIIAECVERNIRNAHIIQKLHKCLKMNVITKLQKSRNMSKLLIPRLPLNKGQFIKDSPLHISNPPPKKKTQKI